MYGDYIKKNSCRRFCSSMHDGTCFVLQDAVYSQGFGVGLLIGQQVSVWSSGIRSPTTQFHVKKKKVKNIMFVCFFHSKSDKLLYLLGGEVETKKIFEFTIHMYISWRYIFLIRQMALLYLRALLLQAAEEDKISCLQQFSRYYICQHGRFHE